MDYRLMADKMTAEQRHKCMSHIRSRDTKPEKTVRRHLFSEGFRYRLNVRYLPGSPDIVLAKYHTMGDEVDKIYIKLKEYENEIKNSNQKLETMFQTNVEYYQSLVKYILAGEQGLKEIDQYLEQMRGEYEKTQDSVVQMDIIGLEQARAVLDQRVMDLRIAENVAMQSVPMMKTMQFSNLNLIRKINSAFIITLPVFKQALTQAILLKRQKIQAEAMAALTIVDMMMIHSGRHII